jgi:hypothetical protein
MKYFDLCPKDRPEETWILYHFTDRVRLRSSYEDLKCKFCGKIDEESALQRGIDPDVTVTSYDDFLASWDHFVLMSADLRNYLASKGVTGFHSYAIPGDHRYVIAWPALLLRTDPSTAGIESHGPICPDCGRPRETCFTSRLGSMALPTNPMTLFASDLWVEKSRGKMTWFTTSELVVKLLRAYGASGIEYHRARY